MNPDYESKEDEKIPQLNVEATKIEMSIDAQIDLLAELIVNQILKEI